MENTKRLNRNELRRHHIRIAVPRTCYSDTGDHSSSLRLEMPENECSNSLNFEEESEHECRKAASALCNKDMKRHQWQSTCFGVIYHITLFVSNILEYLVASVLTHQWRVIFIPSLFNLNRFRRSFALLRALCMAEAPVN